jgi:hypothetical protein
MIDPEDLAGPPSGNGGSGIMYGLVFAGILAACGLFCVFTAHAFVPNITLRGFQPMQPGLLREVHGLDAVLIGLAVFFVAAFAHFHWFWSSHQRLSRYYEIGKVAALLGLIASLAVLLWRAFRLG